MEYCQALLVLHVCGNTSLHISYKIGLKGIKRLVFRVCSNTSLHPIPIAVFIHTPAVVFRVCCNQVCTIILAQLLHNKIKYRCK